MIFYWAHSSNLKRKCILEKTGRGWCLNCTVLNSFYLVRGASCTGCFRGSFKCSFIHFGTLVWDLFLTLYVPNTLGWEREREEKCFAIISAATFYVSHENSLHISCYRNYLDLQHIHIYFYKSALSMFRTSAAKWNCNSRLQMLP